MREVFIVDWLGSTKDQPGTADYATEAEALAHERELRLRGTQAVTHVVEVDE